jgi:hypothetical protein
MSDGQFVVPIVTDDGVVIGWGRGPEPVENANFHKRIGTPLRYLRVVDGAVVEISQADKDALAAEDALAEQKRIDDEAARLDEQRINDEQAAIDAANAPFVIDRTKLHNAVKALGKGAEFRAFVLADEDRMFTWVSARELDSDNQMVVDAMPWFQSLLPAGCTVMDFLRECRV